MTRTLCHVLSVIVLKQRNDFILKNMMYIQHEVGTSVHHSEHSPSVIILSLPIYWEILIGFNLSSRI